jgi:hypothetical protein
MVWPQQVAGKEMFKHDFTELLKRSPYRQSLAQLGS